MAKLNDGELVRIKLECLKKAVIFHTNGLRSKKSYNSNEVTKTAKEFEKYVTK